MNSSRGCFLAYRRDVVVHNLCTVLVLRRTRYRRISGSDQTWQTCVARTCAGCRYRFVRTSAMPTKAGVSCASTGRSRYRQCMVARRDGAPIRP